MEAVQTYIIAPRVKGAFRLGASVLPSAQLDSCVVVFSVKAVLLLAPREADIWSINVYKGQNPVRCHDIFGPCSLFNLYPNLRMGLPIHNKSHQIIDIYLIIYQSLFVLPSEECLPSTHLHPMQCMCV